MYLVLLLLARFSQFSHAFGIENPDAETVGFVQQDNSRDTISLIVSCLVTLGLCVYSAIHLNVPSKHERYWTRIQTEIKWCLVGLFGPELVLYTAWRQWASAKQLCDEVQQASRELRNGTKDNKSSTIERVKSISDSCNSAQQASTWTIVHGFYATMGGFAIDIDDLEGALPGTFGQSRRLTLTAKGVALLAHCGHLPNISMDEILDKNKTDALAKFLVCTQAGWMVLQVISRQGFGLPSTLLEVHTVAHVVCALVVYAMWWHKPRQVESPTLLHGNWVLPIAAYMYSASRMSAQKPRGISGRFSRPKAEMKSLVYFEEREQTLPTDDISPIRRMDTSRTILNGHFGYRPIITTEERPEPTSPAVDREIRYERLRLAAEAVAEYPALRSRFKDRGSEAVQETMPNYLIPYATELVQPYSLNWPNAGLLRRTQSLVMGMVIWGASMAYGAIHVSAWRYFFPSPAEKLLWRLSSVWVTYCAAHWFITNLLAHFFPAIDKIWMAYNERRLHWFWFTGITVLCILCGVSYVASRAFLVIEAFVSIREVPKDVYNTPGWSQVFPHL